MKPAFTIFGKISTPLTFGASDSAAGVVARSWAIAACTSLSSAARSSATTGVDANVRPTRVTAKINLFDKADIDNPVPTTNRLKYKVNISYETQQRMVGESKIKRKEGMRVPLANPVALPGKQKYRISKITSSPQTKQTTEQKVPLVMDPSLFVLIPSGWEDKSLFVYQRNGVYSFASVEQYFGLEPSHDLNEFDRVTATY